MKKFASLLLAMMVAMMPFASFAADDVNGGEQGANKWTAAEFTYDAEGTTVTGLTDSGKALLKETNGVVVVPDKNADGANIIGIGNGPSMGNGVFSFTETVTSGDDGATETTVKYEPTDVTLPSNLETIGNFAFCTTAGDNTKGVAKINLPSTLTTIGQQAFQHAPLTEVVIPDSVTTMGSAVFGAAQTNKVKIKKVTLSKNCEVIPASAFVMQAIDNVVIPEGVKTVGRMAFSGNAVKTLSISNTVTIIDANAFENHQLTRVEIPWSVTTIGNYAFRINQAVLDHTLTEVVLSEGLASIGNASFGGCAITEVELPKSVTTLHKDAFKGNAAEGVAKVTVFSYSKAQANASGDYAKVVVSGTTHDVVYLPKTSEEPMRVAGTTRYDTSIATAMEYKESLGVKSFENIIVASGENYPDALTGSYLAKVKEAPVLLVSKSTEAFVANYVKNNLKEGGTVYILGGEGAVSKAFASKLDGLTVERLGGVTRYDTNLAILKAAGVTDQDILLCTGTNYADSLSASAAGRPIMLVGKSFTKEQKEYLGTLTSSKAYVIGGEGAVSGNIVKEYKAVSDAEVARLAGVSRYETSVEVAKAFFGEADLDYAVLAYGQNFPDGLSGAPLALSYDAPIVLVANGAFKDAKTYLNNAGLKNVFVLGGPLLISNNVAKSMLAEIK